MKPEYPADEVEEYVTLEYRGIEILITEHYRYGDTVFYMPREWYKTSPKTRMFMGYRYRYSIKGKTTVLWGNKIPHMLRIIQTRIDLALG